MKGFIDVYRRIYTISIDTKVLSKVLELLMFPVIARFAEEQGFELVLAPAQNQYPDISLVDRASPDICYALDVKTTYRKGEDKNGQTLVSGMTLGTFGGYFRTRNRPVSSTFAYNRYTKHYVLGVVYSRVQGIDERRVYDIEDLADIPSVARDFQFFLHEKYRIAADTTGSGNTKNIGSSRYLERLLNGTGVFARLGVEVFDDYWMNYLPLPWRGKQDLPRRHTPISSPTRCSNSKARKFCRSLKTKSKLRFRAAKATRNSIDLAPKEASNVRILIAQSLLFPCRNPNYSEPPGDM